MTALAAKFETLNGAAQSALAPLFALTAAVLTQLALLNLPLLNLPLLNLPLAGDLLLRYP